MKKNRDKLKYLRNEVAQMKKLFIKLEIEHGKNKTEKGKEAES